MLLYALILYNLGVLRHFVLKKSTEKSHEIYMFYSLFNVEKLKIIKWFIKHINLIDFF